MLNLILVLFLLVIKKVSAEIKGCSVYSSTPNGYGQLTCITCKPGMFRSIDGLACNPCTSGCTFCTEQGVCQSCIGGFYLTNGICASCGTGCSQCVGQDCTACIEKYTLNTTLHTCMKCEDTCKECDYTGGCTKCNSGYKKTESNGKNICILDQSSSAGLVAFIVLACVVCLPLVICCICFLVCCRTRGQTSAGSQVFESNDPNPFHGFEDGAQDAGYNPNFYSEFAGDPVAPAPNPSGFKKHHIQPVYELPDYADSQNNSIDFQPSYDIIPLNLELQPPSRSNTRNNGSGHPHAKYHPKKMT